MPVEIAGRLLRSPFLNGSEEELTNRALLDVAVRSLGEPHVSLMDIIRLAGHRRCLASVSQARVPAPVVDGAVQGAADYEKAQRLGFYFIWIPAGHRVGPEIEVSTVLNTKHLKSGMSCYPSWPDSIVSPATSRWARLSAC